MLSIRNPRCWPIGVFILGSAMGLQLGAGWAQSLSRETGLAGKPIYASNCAGCHGLDGRGGERAPNIAGGERVRRLSDQRIATIVTDGIPGTGMPAFHELKPAQVRALVSHLRTLQGKTDAGKLPGDPRNGRLIFFGKAECSACHTIAGEGGFLGPDLTAYGSTRSAKTILDALSRPARIVPAGYRLAVATTSDGTRVEGVVRNEDNFTVQMQSRDGSYHLFQKSDLQKLEYQKEPLMPTDYGKRLSHTDFEDLVSYLMDAGRASSTGSTAKPSEEDKE